MGGIEPYPDTIEQAVALILGYKSKRNRKINKFNHKYIINNNNYNNNYNNN